MAIQTIGIIGAGLMGNGIAQGCATNGLKVIMLDVNDAAIARGIKTVSGSLDRLIKKEKMTEAQKTEALGAIRGTTSMQDLSAADFIIEAATENLDLKRKILKDADEVARPEVIIASNTSSISITQLAAATSRPGQFIGMHFFNPVPMMALVEIIRAVQTSDATFAATEALAKRVGKAPICVKNAPGFVVNRILCPMINEAVFALGEGLATAQQIDDAMRMGCNHPIGPLALCDLIGADVELAVMQVLFEGFKDPKYRPAPLLVEMVEAGYLGRKSGRGFYNY